MQFVCQVGVWLFVILILLSVCLLYDNLYGCLCGPACTHAAAV